MTKEEIYEHLANVYLGKNKKRKKKNNLKFYSLLFLNFSIAVTVLAIIFGSLSAIATKKIRGSLNSITFALNYYPLRVMYNFSLDYPQVENFSLDLPNINAEKFNNLSFVIKGLKRDYPKILKIELENAKKEKAFYYSKITSENWHKVNISLKDNFKEISDWSNISKVSFILEAWNVGNTKGGILIDDICFSNEDTTYGTK